MINSQNKCNPDDFTYKVRGLDTNGQRVVHCDGKLRGSPSIFQLFSNYKKHLGNKPGTCQRSLCECDLAFAKELAGEMASDKYQEENSKWKGKWHNYRLELIIAPFQQVSSEFGNLIQSSWKWMESELEHVVETFSDLFTNEVLKWPLSATTTPLSYEYF